MLCVMHNVSKASIDSPMKTRCQSLVAGMVIAPTNGTSCSESRRLLIANDDKHLVGRSLRHVHSVAAIMSGTVMAHLHPIE